MNTFAKVFESILLSSVWTEPDHVLRLWITFLVRKNQHGFVEGSVPGLARLAYISVEKCVEALARLEAPDPHSKTPDNEGRRIAKVEGGWVVLNHLKYRDQQGGAEPSMTPEAIRKRRQREREAAERDGVTERDIERDSHASHALDESEPADPGVSVTSSVTDVTERDTYVSASTSGGVPSSKGEVQEREIALHAYCTRLAVAANKGLAHPIPRILASSGSTLQVAEIIYGADIPIEFAEQVVLDTATRSKSKDSIRSLSYFTPAIVEAWERKSLGEKVKGSKLRSTDEKRSAAVAAVAARPPEPRPEVRVCPYCERMLVEAEWTQHHERKHSDQELTPFTDAQKS